MLSGILPFLPVIGSVASALEARSNRRFQERMSNTAHQREVRDMINAGLNPALSARGGSGASTPSGASGDVSGISSAGVVKAQVELLQAQAQKTRVESADIMNTWATGRARSVAASADIAEMDAQERRTRLPLALERAKAEIAQMTSSARAAQAGALLDELAKEGAGNIADFERRIGEAGPAVRFFYELVKVMRATEGSRRR